MKEGKTKQNRLLQKEGSEYLNRLVKDYPKSRFIAEAHLALAEYYFETNSMWFAKQNYEIIIQKFPKSSMYNYALYKLAWVYFNLSEFEQSIDTFHKVVAQVSAEKSGCKGIIEFKIRLLNDLVVTYAEVDNGWVRARDYFKDLPDEETYAKLRMLGDLYVGQSKFVEAGPFSATSSSVKRPRPRLLNTLKSLLESTPQQMTFAGLIAWSPRSQYLSQTALGAPLTRLTRTSLQKLTL